MKKNISEMPAHYQAEIVSKKGDSASAFNGPLKFVVRPKETFSYELMFTPISEDKFEAELRFHNLTEGVQNKYVLTGMGERRPPLGEIKMETKVGQM